MKNSITDRIFELIKENDLSGAQLARTLGISRTVVSEWKNGRSEPSPKIILKILFHFPEIDANWLVRGITLQNNNTQTATGNYNVQAGGHANVNEPSHLITENKHLKQIITEKEKQIELLKELLKK